MALAEGEPYLPVSRVSADGEGTLYAGTSLGLFVSKDRGRTWARLPRRGDMGGPWASTAAAGLLFALWLHPIGRGRMLWERSDDGGQTWTLLPSQPSSVAPDPFDSEKVYGVRVVDKDPTQPGMPTGRGEFLLSRDGAMTWETLAQLPALAAQSFEPIAVGPAGAIWIAGIDKAIYFTRDQGASFEKVTPPFPIPFYVYSLKGVGSPHTLVVNNGANPPQREIWTFRPPDFGIRSGHFYTQASGQPPEAGLGFPVTNEGGIPFWEEFQRQGGVPALGYPVSQRFVYKGFTTQAFQKAVMQWQPGEGREPGVEGRVFFLNVFDELHQAGKDDWLLAYRATPQQLDPSFDAGKSWEEIVRDRLALLDANPAIRERYFSTLDSLLLYGLPTSRVKDMGNHYALRLQRAAIQQWKVEVPWARAGEVTVANGGDMAKEAGLFPAEAMAPEGPP